MHTVSAKTCLPIQYKLIALGIAILIAVGPTALYLFQEVQHLQENSIPASIVSY